MKSGKIHLFLFVLIAFAVVNVHAQNELPPPEEKPFLVDNPYPALLDLDELYVQIIKTSMAEDVTGINWEELQLGVEKALSLIKATCIHAVSWLKFLK